MKKIQNWFVSKLGGAGFFIYCALVLFFIVFPLQMFALDFLPRLLISFGVGIVWIFGIFNFPFVLEAWYTVGFIFALKGPQDFLAILYYVVFGIVAALALIKILIFIATFIRLLATRNRKSNEEED